jgi:hypothetical protein
MAFYEKVIKVKVDVAAFLINCVRDESLLRTATSQKTYLGRSTVRSTLYFLLFYAKPSKDYHVNGSVNKLLVSLTHIVDHELFLARLHS